MGVHVLQRARVESFDLGKIRITLHTLYHPSKLQVEFRMASAGNEARYKYVGKVWAWRTTTVFIINGTMRTASFVQSKIAGCDKYGFTAANAEKFALRIQSLGRR